MKRFLLSPAITSCLTSALFLGSCSNSKPVEQKPNIILVFTDDLGYGDLGCYGQKLIQSPNIDRMAKEGMLFTEFYTGSPVCAPSRCSLLTGKHTGHSFIRHNINQLPLGQLAIPDDEITIAEILKEQGYATAAMGKWSLGSLYNSGDPLKQGFDRFFGYYCQCKAHNYYPEMIWDNKDTVHLKNETVPVEVNFIDYPLSYATKKVEYSAEIIHNEAMEFIEANKENPFFLYYATTLPHSNGEAPPDEKFEVPDWGIYSDPDKYRDWTPQEKGYASMISMLDKQMAEIMAKLKELGIEKNTLVIFTSDNGPTNFAKRFNSSGELRGRKRDLYEAGTRIPFIAWWPGTIPGGVVSDHPAAMYDLMPTFTEMAGGNSPEVADGLSFLPLLKGNALNDTTTLYWEFYEGAGSPKQAIRIGDWKLIRFLFTTPEKSYSELYHLKTDLSEENNIIEQHPEIEAQLLKAMAQEHSDYVNIKFDPK